MCIDLDFNLYRVSCQSVVCFLGQTLRFGLISDVIICSGSQVSAYVVVCSMVSVIVSLSFSFSFSFSLCISPSLSFHSRSVFLSLSLFLSPSLSLFLSLTLFCLILSLNLYFFPSLSFFLYLKPLNFSYFHSSYLTNYFSLFFFFTHPSTHLSPCLASLTSYICSF